jgi:DNA-binding transcriptional regulator YdaS (Cro superfamily)
MEIYAFNWRMARRKLSYSQLIVDACRRAKQAAGGNTALANALSTPEETITAQAISQWQVVPPNRVLGVEAATGISRHELRPDIYPSEAA